MAKEYIERDALIELANNRVDGVIDASDIAMFPTADVVEVKHGRWVITQHDNDCVEWTTFQCPVCGVAFDGNDTLFNEWKGCPMCLTRMDGGAENE